MFRSIFIVLIFVVNSVKNQTISNGACPSVSVVENFDFNSFSGRWFELYRYPHWYELSGECSWYDFSTDSSPSNIQYSFVYSPVRLIITEKAVIINGSGIINVTMPFEGVSEYMMHVLATDYTSYALLYDCENYLDLNLKRTSSWILSRSMNRTEEARQAVTAVMTSIHGLEEVLHKKVDFSTEACFSVYDAIVTDTNNNIEI